MKKRLISIGLVLLTLLAAVSCKETLEKVLSADIPLNNFKVQFTVSPEVSKSASASQTRGSDSENLLYEGDLNINIVEEIENHGFSFENLKSLLLENSTLKLVAPIDYDLSDLKDVKLYFGNRNNLVAEADAVSSSEIKFKVVDGELLNQLKQDNLHIILTGQLPTKKIDLELVMDYVAKVSLVK